MSMIFRDPLTEKDSANNHFRLYWHFWERDRETNSLEYSVVFWDVNVEIFTEGILRDGRQRWRGTGGLDSSVYSYGDMNERLLSPPTPTSQYNEYCESEVGDFLKFECILWQLEMMYFKQKSGRVEVIF